MKNSTLFNLSAFSVLVILLMTFNSCAPVFSELQDARLVGKNNVEATGGYSTVSSNGVNGGGNDKVQNEITIAGAYGLSNNFDARFRYAAVWLHDGVGDGVTSMLSFGPKFKLLENHLAFYLPVGFAFGAGAEISNSWQTHPTLLGTIPVVDKLDINPSFKVLFPLGGEQSTLVAVNLGLGIKVLDGLTVRPEYGVLFDPGAEGTFRQFSLGVTYFPKFKNKTGK